MQGDGQPLVFRVEDLQPYMINKLIDNGIRFVLKSSLLEGVDVYDKIEEVLDGEVHSLRQDQR